MDQFQCAHSFQCIPESWRCDEEFDCADQSDEEDCPTMVPGTIPPQHRCPTGHYQCLNNVCLPAILRCDGVPDCPDGEDEYSCRKCVCVCQLGFGFTGLVPVERWGKSVHVSVFLGVSNILIYGTTATEMCCILLLKARDPPFVSIHKQIHQ